MTFEGKLAVLTGGGSGMGRELVARLAGEGCSVATCDTRVDTLQTSDSDGVRITAHACDVADPASVARFRDEVAEQHGRGHVDLLFNNAGSGGGNSFVLDEAAEWERTFAVCFGGVYNCTRAFLPLLLEAEAAWIVNTSSNYALAASGGTSDPSHAYSTAKFAVRGFSEALIADLRRNAPHVRVALVFPGWVGTDIIANTMRALGDARAQTGELDSVLAVFRDEAPTTVEDAVAAILDGIRSGEWRIVIGDDAQALDEAVRRSPAGVYDEWREVEPRWLQAMKEAD